MRRFLAFGAVAATALLAAPAAAQDRVAAEALFDAARRLMEAGDFAQACPKLEQSQKLDPAVGTLLYLGECFEKLGKTASAWATFREASSAAQAAGQGERARIGRDRAARLEPRLARLSIVVAAGASTLPGFAVLRDGKPVDPSLFGVALPVDPGEHVVEATAEGHRPFRVVLRTDEAGKTEQLEVPMLEPAPAVEEPASAPPPAPRRVAPRDDGPRPTVPPPTSDAGSTQRTLGWVLGGAGVLGLGVGTWFGLTAFSRNDSAQDLCPRSPACDSERGVTLTEEAKDAAFVSNLGFGVGGAFLVTGVVLLATAPSSRPVEARRTRQVAITPVLSESRAGLALGGRF